MSSILIGLPSVGLSLTTDTARYMKLCHLQLQLSDYFNENEAALAWNFFVKPLHSLFIIKAFYTLPSVYTSPEKKIIMAIIKNSRRHSSLIYYFSNSNKHTNTRTHTHNATKYVGNLHSQL